MPCLSHASPGFSGGYTALSWSGTTSNVLTHPKATRTTETNVLDVGLLKIIHMLRALCCSAVFVLWPALVQKYVFISGLSEFLLLEEKISGENIRQSGLTFICLLRFEPWGLFLDQIFFLFLHLSSYQTNKPCSARAESLLREIDKL